MDQTDKTLSIDEISLRLIIIRIFYDEINSKREFETIKDIFKSVVSKVISKRIPITFSDDSKLVASVLDDFSEIRYAADDIGINDDFSEIIDAISRVYKCIHSRKEIFRLNCSTFHFISSSKKSSEIDVQELVKSKLTPFIRNNCQSPEINDKVVNALTGGRLRLYLNFENTSHELDLGTDPILAKSPYIELGTTFKFPLDQTQFKDTLKAELTLFRDIAVPLSIDLLKGIK